MPSGHYLTQEQTDYIRRNFHNTPNRVLAERLCVSLSAISNIQRKYHLIKSDEYNKYIHHLSGKASASSWGKIVLTPEVIAKRVESFKRTYRIEKCRRAWGLEQKTKLKIKVHSKKRIDHRNYLKRRGYIIDDAKLIAYYTTATRRSTRLEMWPKKYYEFKPYEEL